MFCEVIKFKQQTIFFCKNCDLYIFIFFKSTILIPSFLQYSIVYYKYKY